MSVQSGTAIREFVDEVRRRFNEKHGELGKPVMRGEFDGRDPAFDRRIGLLEGLRFADAIIIEVMEGYGGREIEDAAPSRKRKPKRTAPGKSWEIDNPPPPRAAPEKPPNGAQS